MVVATTRSANKPSIIILFGITGDLAQRKLLPAIYHMFKDDLVHPDTIILGVPRRDVTTEQLLAQVELCVNEVDNICDPVAMHKVQKSLRMHQMSLTDGAEYDELLQLLNDIEATQGICMDRLYYLSIPPQMFEPIVRNLGQHGHNQSCQHGAAATRLLIEKPFGYDSVSATELLAETAEWFSQEQTYRVDHYVAKNAVVDLLNFRRSHPELANIWNQRHITSIEITAFEQLDIEGRAIFYDAVGALRDIIQSHLLQVMAIATMDIPAGASSDDLHAARLALLQSVSPISADTIASSAVRGQYNGYRDEVGRDDSVTETYAGITVVVNTPAWQGVPITLRTGKGMATKITEVRIRFNDSSELVCHIQPDSGLQLIPDDATSPLRPAIDEFKVSNAAEPRYADAYERILIEASKGDRDLFTSCQEVLAAWHIVDYVVQAWSKNDNSLIHYEKGSANVEPQ